MEGMYHSESWAESLAEFCTEFAELWAGFCRDLAWICRQFAGDVQSLCKNLGGWGRHSEETEVASLMIRDIYGNELRFRSGEFYSNKDRASLNSWAEGAITLKMAKLRVCQTNGWHHSEIDDGEFLNLAHGLGYWEKEDGEQTGI